MKITIGVNQREVKKAQYLLNNWPRVVFDFQNLIMKAPIN